jgi:hypothetical protein
MVTEMELLQSPDPNPSDFSIWTWMKKEVNKRQVDTRDELLVRILDAAANIKTREAQQKHGAILNTSCQIL